METEPGSMSTPFGVRLRDWRTYLRLTQAEFAKQFDIHVGMLKKYETGRSMPSAEVLAQLANSGASLNWLLTGDGPMATQAPTRRQRDQAFDVIATSGLEPPTDCYTDKFLARVFDRLAECMRTVGAVPWLPLNVEDHECHWLAKEATGLLRIVAGHDQGRLGAIMLGNDYIDAALLLAWRHVEEYRPYTRRPRNPKAALLQHNTADESAPDVSNASRTLMPPDGRHPLLDRLSPADSAL